eukprot:64053-Pleurochrysis_carterae.AAC.2
MDTPMRWRVGIRCHKLAFAFWGFVPQLQAIPLEVAGTSACVLRNSPGDGAEARAYIKPVVQRPR